MSPHPATETTVRALLGRAPEWIRSDFSSKEPAVRARAEETLAAMIDMAIDKSGSHAAPGEAGRNTDGERR